MLIYLSLLIPFIAGIVLLVFFKHKAFWVEPLVAFGITFLFIFIFKYFCEVSQTDDTEYYGGYITHANYYEPWDEEVSCRHPIYCTRTYPCGKSMCTSTYVCGHHHAYDVDYHPARWEMVNNLGESWGISQAYYNQLKSRWKSKETFVDLHRRYHSIDGDKYVICWDWKEASVELTTTEHSYENRVQASHTIMNYEKVDTSDVRKYKLFEYPKINGFNQDGILGIGGVNYIPGLKHINYLNGLLGKDKKLRCYVLLFKNQPEKVGFLQERYWKGGNKNEFIICIGLDKNDNIVWNHNFSWTKAEEPKIEIRNYILENKIGKKLDMLDISNFIFKTLQGEYKYRSFEEFSYLTIEPSNTQITWCFIIVFIINCLMGWVIVVNDIDPDKNNFFKIKDKFNNYYSRW